MERILRGVTSGVTLYVYDDSGVLVDATGTVTVAVMNGAGTNVSSGNATKSATGTYSYTITAQSSLDTLTVTWSGTVAGNARTWTTTAEVCGGHLFEIADLRASDVMLADSVLYPAAKVRQKRIEAEQRFENACRRAFTRRGKRVVLDGNNRPTLMLPDVDIASIYELKIDGTVVSDLSNIAVYPDGRLTYTDGTVWETGERNISVWYAYGMQDTPEPVRGACLLLASDALIPSAVPRRATAQSTDIGDFRLTIAGRDGETGIPDVDAVIVSFASRRPAVG